MGKVADIKTKETDASVTDFLNAIKDEQKRKDSFAILKMMQKATKEKPKLWGSAIIGFGNQRYKSPTSGREVDWFRIGFSPRKSNFSLYIGMKVNIHGPEMKKLGKHKTGLGCLYINQLDDVDVKMLGKMISAAAKKK
jgi:hypothetical protein